MALIRVLVVDDHPLMREGLALILQEEAAEFEIAGLAGTGQEAIATYQQLSPDVTVMDLRLPDMSGIDVIRSIRRLNPQALIVALTTFPGDALASQAIQAGATGYLLKAGLRRDLLETIRAVHAGGFKVANEVASDLARRYAEERLTEREIDVLREVAAGHANKIVADRLSISEATVKGHIRSILLKLKANDRTHAVTIAVKRGFIEL